jgi:Zn-dependent oligopeptidase
MRRRDKKSRKKQKKQRGGQTLIPMQDFKGLTVDQVKELQANRTTSLNKLKEDLLKIEPEALTFSNFILPQIDIMNDYPEYPYYSMKDLHENEDVRKTCSEAKIADEKVWDGIDGDLFSQFEHYYNNQYTTEQGSLIPEFQRYMEYRNANYRDLGLRLNATKKDRIEKLRNKIKENEGAFETNRQKYKPEIFLTEDQLSGMPAEFIEKRLSYKVLAIKIINI